jgi:hypothetical protein
MMMHWKKVASPLSSQVEGFGSRSGLLSAAFLRDSLNFLSLTPQPLSLSDYTSCDEHPGYRLDITIVLVPSSAASSVLGKSEPLVRSTSTVIFPKWKNEGSQCSVIATLIHKH